MTNDCLCVSQQIQNLARLCEILYLQSITGVRELPIVE